MSRGVQHQFVPCASANLRCLSGMVRGASECREECNNRSIHPLLWFHVPCVHETQATMEQLFKHGFDVMYVVKSDTELQWLSSRTPMAVINRNGGPLLMVLQRSTSGLRLLDCNYYY